MWIAGALFLLLEPMVNPEARERIRFLMNGFKSKEWHKSQGVDIDEIERRQHDAH